MALENLALRTFLPAGIEGTGAEPRGMTAARTYAITGLLLLLVVAAAAFGWTQVEIVTVGGREEARRLALSVLFTPALAGMAIVGVGLLLIWLRLARWLAGWIELSEAFVALWGWFRIPVALFLLMLVVLFVYRFAPNRTGRFGSFCPARFSP